MRYERTRNATLGCAGAAFISLASSQVFAQSSSVIEQVSANTDAMITLQGSDNDTSVTQSGWDLSADVAIDGVENNQGDSDNQIVQTGAVSTATVDLTGDRNTFNILQTGGSLSEASNNNAALEVVGNDNDAIIVQDNAFGDDYANQAVISQIGSYNVAQVSQTIAPDMLSGGSNNATISQTGDDNEALIEQSGVANTATITQDGFDNFGSITQDGEGYAASLTQMGEGLSYSITQSPCLIGAACSDMTISVTQTSGAPPSGG